MPPLFTNGDLSPLGIYLVTMGMIAGVIAAIGVM